MTKATTPLRKKLLLLLIPTLVGTAYFGSTVLSSSAKKDRQVVKVNNLTHSSELLNVEKHKDHIKLSIQNNSNKAITAFVITSPIDAGTVFTVKEEFLFSQGDFVIFPGQQYDKIIGIPDYRRDEITLNLSAVMFEDGAGEGDPQTIRGIEDSRLGEKVQLMKALTVLERLSKLSDVEIGAYWHKTAKSDFETALNAPNAPALMRLNKMSLNEEANEGSEEFKLGAHTGNEDVARMVLKLTDIQARQGTSAFKAEVLRIRSLYTKMITRL